MNKTRIYWVGLDEHMNLESARVFNNKPNSPYAVQVVEISAYEKLRRENSDLRIAMLLDNEEHACQTGDCLHERQTECDSELAKIKHPFDEMREQIQKLTAALEKARAAVALNIKHLGQEKYADYLADQSNASLAEIDEILK